MIARTSWLVYRKNFPRREEVKRTEEYMSKNCVVPKLTMKPHYSIWCDTPKCFLFVYKKEKISK